MTQYLRNGLVKAFATIRRLIVVSSREHSEFFRVFAEVDVLDRLVLENGAVLADLAAEVQEAESALQSDALVSRGRILSAIERRYTPPAGSQEASGQ